jgi:hypothetical protein
MNQSIACRSTLHSTAALWHPGCGAIRNEFDSFTFQPSSFPTLGHSWGGKRSCKCSRRLIEESSHVPNVVHLILFLQTSLAVVACSRSGSVLAAHTTLHTITQVTTLERELDSLRARLGTRVGRCGPTSGSCKEAKSRLCAAVHDRPSAPLIAAL